MKLITKYIIAILVLMVLVSCGLLGPTYARPKIDTPATFRNNHNLTAINTNNITDIQWWYNFKDPTLNQLIKRALDNNNNIQIAINNIGVARAQLEQVHMAWIPTLNLGAAANTGQIFNFNSQANNPQFNTLLGNTNTNNFNFYGAGLIPSYSLNIFSLVTQANAARANLEVQQAIKNATRLTVISQVAGSYFILLALQQQIIMHISKIQDLTKLWQLSQIQYKHGYVALTDIQQYKEQLEQAKIILPELKQNVVVTQNALQVLLNQNPGDISTVKTFNDINTNNIIPASLPSSVLRNRPDIQQAEGQLKLANADIGVATSKFFPNIKITTPLSAFNSIFSQFGSASGNFWSSQIQATMPILNAGLLALVKEKKSAYYVAYYNYIQTVKISFASVDDDFAKYNAINQTLVLSNEIYQTVQLKHKLGLKNYTAGYVAYIDILPLKVALDIAADNVLQVKLEKLQALVRLYQDLGGGYHAESAAL